VIDEAHCVLNWGSTFRPTYLHCKEIIALFPNVAVLCLTATVPPSSIKIIHQLLTLKKDYVLVRENPIRSNIKLTLRPKSDKNHFFGELLRELFSEGKGCQKTLVFFGSLNELANTQASFHYVLSTKAMVLDSLGNSYSLFESFTSELDESQKKQILSHIRVESSLLRLFLPRLL